MILDRLTAWVHRGYWRRRRPVTNRHQRRALAAEQRRHDRRAGTDPAGRGS